MKHYFRRKNPVLYENNENPVNPEKEISFAGEENTGIKESEENDDYALLITAQDNSEAAVIESILRNARIPYVTREKDSESWMRVMMGYNIFGEDFFVPARLLDDAAALLVPEDAEGEDIMETETHDEEGKEDQNNA